MEKKRNDELRKLVTRSVVSFLNSEGGAVIIGVEDSGNVYGLNADLNLFGQSRDKFHQSVASLLLDQIGPGFMSLIRMRFDTANDKDVFVLEVDPSSQPAFAKVPRGKEFLIRVGSTSQPLDSEATVKYIQAHFK